MAPNIFTADFTGGFCFLCLRINEDRMVAEAIAPLDIKEYSQRDVWVVHQRRISLSRLHRGFQY
ncbi:hypothetical protein GS682_02960 [Nostoc sp. B(2019)]|nr:hypothetical protein [Nostoc sp. B(2019)]